MKIASKVVTNNLHFIKEDVSILVKILIILISLIVANNLFGQVSNPPPQKKIMTLGVFHFDYPNLDVVKVEGKDQISVLDEPFQSEIKSICKAIEEFNPTIIAIEFTPDKQHVIDSLYQLYIADIWELRKNEVYQLGFRIGKDLNLDRIYCIDDPGKHYENLLEIFNDSVRLSKFEHFYLNSRDSIYEPSLSKRKITSIIETLYDSNRPEVLMERLSSYLLHPFKYEEQPGDFTGVDFETGRWYNRNLRIFRNIQKISHSTDDRILLIIGSEHLNLLNIFFDASREFELVSPLQFLEKAKLR